MGAEIKATNVMREEYPPITIKGGALKAINYKMPVASAQVKSAILLAGLFAKGVTRVNEPVKTRDHTERMLKSFKADIKSRDKEIILKGNRELSSPGLITVPGDISSASFFMVLAAIIPDSRIVIKNVSLNPTRAGVINVLKRMQADIKIKVYSTKSAEPVGDIIVRTSNLKGTVVKKAEIPTLIDELPILMVAACNAEGSTIFEGVQELRVKETDRIRSMQENLKKMGALFMVSKGINSEKVIIKGKNKLNGSKVKSFGDHRTAMSMVIAGLKAEGKTSIDDVSCINKSFPEFLKTLKSIIP
jgi:3-phosphoshikimate 1-carboxyvinyltransferase